MTTGKKITRAPTARSVSFKCDKTREDPRYTRTSGHIEIMHRLGATVGL